MNNMQVTEPIVTRAPEHDWSGWEKWLRGHLDIEREVMIEAFGEALGLASHELRDRISALELKLAELTGAIDILPGTTPPPERDTRALGELLSTERREFGERTRGFELKLAELTGAVDILRGPHSPPPAQFPSVKAFSADTIYHEATSSPLPAVPGRRSATPRAYRARRIGFVLLQPATASPCAARSTRAQAITVLTSSLSTAAASSRSRTRLVSARVPAGS